MKAALLDAKSLQMLELLAQGAQTKLVARKMGYSEGTIRVYLHHLYKKIGVRNKTEAVIWHIGRMRPPAAQAASPASSAGLEQTFGDMALQEELYVALGVMSTFVGPYGRIWEVGRRLKGEAPDEALLARRAQARNLWRALLQGDFAAGKAVDDEGVTFSDAPTDGVLLASLLMLGGYASAGRLVGQLERRKGAGAISRREENFLRSLHDAVNAGDPAAFARLNQLAAEGGKASIVQQFAIAALFHIYRARKEPERARAMADAMWIEAEAARRELEAMGEKPLPRAGRAKADSKQAATEKAAAAAR